MAKLVAWEGKDFKAARLELFVEALCWRVRHVC
jgi:hypothetical protein